MRKVLRFDGFVKGIKTGTTHSTNQWKSLVQIGFEIFDKECKIEELSFHEKCRYLYKVLQLSSEYSSIWKMVQRRLPEIEKWFESPDLRNSSSDAKLAFLRIINFVQELLQRENRQYLCRFGERFVTKVMWLGSNDNCFDEAVKFFTIQMKLHHPKGAQVESKGAFFFDENTWRQDLIRIFHNMVETKILNDYKHNRRRNTLAAKHFILSETLMNLAKRLSQQIVFYEQKSNSNLENGYVTQIVPLDITQQNEGAEDRPNKRRKIESFRETFFKNIQISPDKVEESILPWLQILNGIIPTLEGQTIQEVQKIIVDLCQSCKTIGVKDYLLRCASNFVKSFKVEPWLAKMLWDTAMNSVTSNQSIQQGNNLMQILIEKELVIDSDRLFLSQVTEHRIKSNESSIQTLVVLIKKNPQSINSQERKEFLLQWLFGNNEQSEKESTWNTLIKVIVHFRFGT